MQKKQPTAAKRYSVNVGSLNENYDGETFERFSTNNKKEALKKFNRLAKSEEVKKGWQNAYAVIELIDNKTLLTLKIKRIKL